MKKGIKIDDSSVTLFLFFGNRSEIDYERSFGFPRSWFGDAFSIREDNGIRLIKNRYLSHVFIARPIRQSGQPS